MSESDEQEATKGCGPLRGVRVLDVATVIAGPGAARHLADFGADVIKVERPGGDNTRGMGWTIPGDPDSLFWKLVNRGKRSIVLDLKSPAGLTTLKDLARTSDILIENMRPGRLEKLGIGPEVLHDINPRLVILRVSGFGQTGPYSQRPGFATIAEALSGFSDLSGTPGGAPLLPPIALTDEVTGLIGAFACLLALRHAERTGAGQVVDVNLLDSMIQIMGPLPSAWAHLGYLQPRMGSGIPYTVPRGTYQCADGVWVALSASADSVAQRLLNLLGVGHDERFRDFQGRFEHRAELEQHTADWIGARTSVDVIASFEAVDAAIAPVYTMREVVEDPHIKERRSLRTVDGILMQSVVARLELTPGYVQRGAPSLGEHTREVLEEIHDRQMGDSSAES
ncbi:CaiB/BaiF CoA transferase family protein [Gemmatimonas sp.]|uniref:CaiB/BaiF CoA transferase family protein n=1 Tax=Gemmatimonas sp. TaxID=1962908 RepID=UPI0035624E90